RRRLPRRRLRPGDGVAGAGRVPPEGGVEAGQGGRGPGPGRDRDRGVLTALRQRRDHVPPRHPRHLRRAGDPRQPWAPAQAEAVKGSGAMRRRLAAVVVVFGLVGLAACGGGSGDTSSSPSTPKAAKLSLGFSAWPGWFPWQVAEDKGIFVKHGLNVDLKYLESYLDSLNALATGNIDGNSQTLNDTISSVSGGSKQSIVLTNVNSTGIDQIIVAPGIAKVEDLKGMSVAVEEGTVDHYLLLLGLQQAGMGP